MATKTTGAVMDAPTAGMAITIPSIDKRTLSLKLVSDSPLICHAWSHKAVQMMLDKQMKKAKSAKEAKDPWLDFCDSLYWITERTAKPTEKDVESAVFGFPTVAFKAAAVGACRFSEGIKMTEARGAFHVNGAMDAIESAAPKMRQDMVRVGMGTADVRFRGEFTEWAVTLTVSYNATSLSPEQIVNLFNIAGFGVGVGEWRPEKDGSYGRFHAV
jgi:hypothetical protein